MEIARNEKAAEIESALAKQKAELEEKYGAELDTVMEEAQKLAADYRTQLPGIQDRAWELGWKAALRKDGVPGDSLVFRNPLKFSSSDSDLHSIIDSPLATSPSSQAPPAANAGPEASAAVPSNSEVPPEAPPVADAAPEALQASP